MKGKIIFCSTMNAGCVSFITHMCISSCHSINFILFLLEQQQNRLSVVLSRGGKPLKEAFENTGGSLFIEFIVPLPDLGGFTHKHSFLQREPGLGVVQKVFILSSLLNTSIV